MKQRGWNVGEDPPWLTNNEDDDDCKECYKNPTLTVAKYEMASNVAIQAVLVRTISKKHLQSLNLFYQLTLNLWEIKSQTGWLAWQTSPHRLWKMLCRSHCSSDLSNKYSSESRHPLIVLQNWFIQFLNDFRLIWAKTLRLKSQIFLGILTTFQN